MARRKTIVEDSLELLLDTMCNTFGGVMFIALLLIIITSTASRNYAETEGLIKSSVAMEKLEGEIEDLRLDFNSLIKELERKKKVVNKNSELEKLAEISEKIRSKKIEAVDIKSQINVEKSRALRMDSKLDGSAEDLDALKARIKALPKEIKAVTDMYSENKKVLSRIKAPQQEGGVCYLSELNTTYKIPIYVFLQGGKAYSISNPDCLSLVEHGYINLAGFATDDVDVKITENGQNSFSTPKASGGTVIRNSDDFKKFLSRYENNGESLFEPLQAYFIYMIVHVDSFELFSEIKRTISEAGWSFNWKPELDDRDIELYINFEMHKSY